MRGGEREMAKRGVIKGGWWRRVSSKMDGGGGFGRSGWWRRLWEKWVPTFLHRRAESDIMMRMLKTALLKEGLG